MRKNTTKEEHTQDLNNMFNQMRMLLDMYSECSNVEVIGVLHLLIHSLANSSVKPLDDSDK